MSYQREAARGLAVEVSDGGWRGLETSNPRFPGTLEALLSSRSSRVLSDAAATLARGDRVDVATVTILPPLSRPSKIVCIGLNYAEHAKEAAMQPQAYPSLFTRFATTSMPTCSPAAVCSSSRGRARWSSR